MTDTKHRIDLAKWLLERTLGWIATADTKTGMVIAIDLAMVGGLAAAFNASLPAARTYWCIKIVLLATACLAIAIFCAAMAALPRLSGPPDSLIFFGKIADRPVTAFVDKFSKVSESELLTDLATQIHRNAHIAKDKHHWVRRGLFMSFLAVLPWICALALLARK